MHRRLLSAAATAALLLGLAACGEPTEGPVTTPPPSIDIAGPSDGGGEVEPSDGGGETDEPTAEAPSIPPPDPADFAGMDEHTAEGAEQAFRYYIAVTFWGYQSGNSSAAKELYGPSCSGCQNLSDQIERIASDGTFWGPFEITGEDISAHNSNNYDYEISYLFTVSEHVETDPTTNEAPNAPRKDYSAIGGMTWSGKHWSLDGLSVRGNDGE